MSSPVPAGLRPIASPLAWAYGVVIDARNRRYDRGTGVQRVPVPVISVGNLSVGGVGKTPFVVWVARRLLAGGHRPVVAMRGYGAGRGTPSDEAAEYAETLPEIDVVVGADRVAGLRAYLPSHPRVDCVLLDDGFQHRRLGRTLDLVLVDATRSTLRDRLLPAGLLREPPASLRRADAVIVTRAAGVDHALAEAITRVHGRPPLAWACHDWPHLRIHASGGVAETVPRDWLRGKRVATMVGVGHPAAVIEQVRAAGAIADVDVRVRDHQRYSTARLRRIARRLDGVDALFVTGKDWVKLRSLLDSIPWRLPVVVPQLAIEVLAGEHELTELLRRTLDVIPPNPAVSELLR